MTPPIACPAATSILKRQKQLGRKNVRFDQVTVYYFARRQGFTSVPSQGGSSLGMAPRHNSVRSYTLCEFAQEQEVNHREILREHLKEEKLHAKKMKVPEAAPEQGLRVQPGAGGGGSPPWVFYLFPCPWCSWSCQSGSRQRWAPGGSACPPAHPWAGSAPQGPCWALAARTPGFG